VVRVGDARFLRDQWPANSVDAIVTNPPYGGRIGRFWDFNDLYVRFLTDAHHILKPSGKIVMLVWKRGLFRRVVDRFGLLHIRHVRIVETGGIYPGIFVLEKAPESD
jgi:putative N6-adenine-specific DNA methylase/tRNA (guanine6-N2)-methyltransferase